MARLHHSITQFLDDTGEIAASPAAARRTARFQVSIVDAVTRVYPTAGHDTAIFFMPLYMP